MTGTILPTLRRSQPEVSTMYETLGAFYRQGRAVNWKNMYAKNGRVVSLPAYAWNKKRFWIQPVKKYSSGKTHKGEISLRPLSPTEGQWGHTAEEAHCFYEIQWTPIEPVAGDSGAPAAAGSAWLIFSQNGDLALHVSEHLRQFGCRVIWVEPGESYGRSKADLFKIRPDTYEDYRNVIAAVSSDHSFLARGAIYLNGLDQSTHEGISPDQLSRVACEICLGATYLARALSEDGQIQGDPRLWIVTMGGQPVDGRCSVAALGQSTLWGLGRAISLERPSIWGGMVDLDPDEPSSLAARRLAHEIMHAGQEDQIGYRRGLRFVPRLAHVDTLQKSPNPLPLQKNSTYLVTGGLGSLGLAVANWMVENGACSLVLLGRTGLQEKGDSNYRGFKIKGVEHLRNIGAEVDVAAQNACDEAAMESLFARYRDLGRPIRGIVHAAGVISERPINELGEKDFEAVFQAKIGGTWALHRVSQNGDIDFLILFSSASAILGGKDLTHYAAGNAFLDAMAHYRRSMGAPALSVNWGLWADGNASAKIIRYFERIGLKSMANQTALAGLAILLGMRAVQMMCGEFEWNRFLPIYEAKRRRPLLCQIAEEGSSIAMTASRETEGIQKSLNNLSPIERRSHLLGHVRKVVADLLGFAEADLSDSRTGFFQMGMDSIMAVELQKRLEIDLRCTLTPTVSFEHPTIDTLTDHLAAVVFGKAEVIAAPRVDRPLAPSLTPKKETAQLSEDELLDLLAKKLQQR